MFFLMLQATNGNGDVQINPYAQIAGTGVVGALLLVALFVIRYLYSELKEERRLHDLEIDKKDAALNAEMRARIEDAQKYNTISMTIQKETIDTVNKLSDMFEVMERRDTKREKES